MGRALELYAASEALLAARADLAYESEQGGGAGRPGAERPEAGRPGRGMGRREGAVGGVADPLCMQLEHSLRAVGVTGSRGALGIIQTARQVLGSSLRRCR
uniref:Uncharacterized protein n=1 Tax=Emiliania huxleyi TaxID=2903 RepID=A0A7S3SRS1_EMIHU